MRDAAETSRLFLLLNLLHLLAEEEVPEVEEE